MLPSTTEQSSNPYQVDGGKFYHETIHGGLGEYGYSLLSGRRAAKMQPYILTSDTVLEYGIGPGWNLANVKAKIRKGFDIAESVRALVEAHGIEFANCITQKDFNAYDVVICSHVLEHLEQPTDVLATILDCLKPGGKALLYVPFDVGRRFRKYDPAEPNHHLYGWCVQSFGNLVTLCGFRVVEGRLRHFGYERIIAKWVERLKLPSWSYRLLLRITLAIKPEYEIAFIVTKPHTP
jgi:SAM-dependent methyltransferase